jgi:hypothetical protein
MYFHDHILNLALDGIAKLVADRQIEAPIHNSETVRRADDGVRRLLKVVACQNDDLREDGEGRLPLGNKRGGSIDQPQLRGQAGIVVR